MLVIIKSAADTADGIRGVIFAKDSEADLVLLQNGVYFAQKGRLGDFIGAVYVLNDDKRLRGIKTAEIDDDITMIDYERLTDLLADSDKVVGMF